MPIAVPRPVRTWSPWAREYARDPERYVFGTVPSDWAREIARLVRPGDAVLDLGCGEGRDRVFFAELGATVTGVDLSADGLDKARRLARGRGVRVCWIEGGMTEALPAGCFDLIFSCGSIHYVPRAERRPLFRRLAAMTRPGGHRRTWSSPTSSCTKRRERSWTTSPRESCARRSSSGKSCETASG